MYQYSNFIPKKDRFGIYLKIENILLELIELSINASLQSKNYKFISLNKNRSGSIKKINKDYFRIKNN